MPFLVHSFYRLLLKPNQRRLRMNPLQPIEYYFKKANFQPTEKQEEAILYSNGPLFLTAGPGSGKTRVLLWRTLNLLAFHNVKPEEIFLSTFTEKAALQLKDGLRTLLAMVSNETGRPFDISKMAVGTVHSICNTIISDRKFSDGERRIAPKVLDELDQYLYLYNRNNWIALVAEGGFETEEAAQRAINFHLGGKANTLDKASSSRHDAVANIIKLFNRFSEEHFDPSNASTEDPTLLPLIKMYAHYLKMLRERHPRISTVDLSLLQLEAYRSIISSQKGKHVYKHIIIDEYQDTNSIQEKIFFELGKGHKNICVVGDDDQALYRFRGASVENLVEFGNRCDIFLGVKPHRIDLIKNFRSKKSIVDTYNHFINLTNWQKDGNQKGHYRIQDKIIDPHQKDKNKSVVVTSHAKPPVVGIELANFIKKLKSENKINDFNEVAFLFPAMKTNAKVRDLKAALESEGIPVYAPRAGRFLQVTESVEMFGLIAHVLGKPPFFPSASGSMREFQSWVSGSYNIVKDPIIKSDKQLTAFIEEKKNELEVIAKDFELLQKVIEKKKWDEKLPVQVEQVAELAKISGLSKVAAAILSRHSFRELIKNRERQGKPIKLSYVVNRVTSVDWSVLDLFYRLCGFSHFKKMFDLAENGTDEGPICNLSLIAQYIARYMESFPTVITGRLMTDHRFVKLFFNSYLYALFRLQESEYENPDDPFPKGRVPFLTIHQAKGLEFPVVVLGSTYKRDWGANVVEEIIRDLMHKEGEPLDRIGLFDNMRMFYVALSRGKQLMILPRYKGVAGATDEFKQLFADKSFPELSSLKVNELPDAEVDKTDLGKNYSYTGDYLQFRKCPRQYMVFKKYDFVPSRSQTMFFGSLVHKTIEDLHSYLIHERSKATIS
jgi:DNA helicase-2/ATP-dependent DNA helicase PcrA